MTPQTAPLWQRLHPTLRDALGPEIAAALADPNVKDIELNSNGLLFLDKMIPDNNEQVPIGRMSHETADTIIRLVASYMGVSATPDTPRVAGTLPSGERFQGMLPPIVEHPAFVIRKPPSIIFTLADYVRDGIISEAAAAFLSEAAADRLNILVAGGAGSGKTTLTNALLATPAFKEGRILIIQDVDELQCDAPNHLSMFTKPAPPAVTMRDLIKDSLRLNPTRIVVGEVRDGSALDMLRAWNTGHPGGLATLHANSALDALYRIEDLTSEVSEIVPKRAIAASINIVVFIMRTATGRRVTEISRITGVDHTGYLFDNLSDLL